MSDLLYAKSTSDILKKLPYWFKARKDSKNSIGARYLNIFGLELDDARYIIDYAYEQCYITTVDDTQIDFCYKVIVPMPFKLSDLKTVFANNIGLYKAETLKEFFGTGLKGITDKPLHTFELYYADENRNILYVRRPFNADAVNTNGKISIEYKDGTKHTLPLVPHHVWNFLDELGALVSCPRIPLEPNVEYKKRILDVFINPANASRDGLINGIARELSIRRNLEWKDPYQDIELEDPMIVLNSIKLNNKYIDQDRVYITGSETVVLKAYKKDTAPERVDISYVHGLEMHEFHNTRDLMDYENELYMYNKKNSPTLNIRFAGRRDIDTVLYNQLYTIEGRPKPKLREYINIINAESPIFWDNFHWNEHYWDQNEADTNGIAYIPNLYDASVQGFKGWKNK